MGLLDYLWGDTEEQKEARLAATPFQTKSRSCTDPAWLALYLLALLGWLAVALLGFIDGRPEQILYPTDSSGNICGRGEFAERPLMLMFDISRCAGITRALQGCPTPSICVRHCPDLEWSYKEGKLSELRDFCYDMTDEEWESQTVEELVMMRLCPAYLLPQRPFFDRCLPSLVQADGRNVSNSSLAGLEQVKVFSVDDGEHTNYTITFNHHNTVISSIDGFVKKLSRTNDQNTTRLRQRRNLEEAELNFEEPQTEYNEGDFNMTDSLYNDDNTTKRDLSDLFDIDSLREGVDELKRILDLKSLSERLLWDLSCYWWILLLFYFLAFILSFLWIGKITPYKQMLYNSGLQVCSTAVLWPQSGSVSSAVPSVSPPAWLATPSLSTRSSPPAPAGRTTSS